MFHIQVRQHNSLNRVCIDSLIDLFTTCKSVPLRLYQHHFRQNCVMRRVTVRGLRFHLDARVSALLCTHCSLPLLRTPCSHLTPPCSPLSPPNHPPPVPRGPGTGMFMFRRHVGLFTPGRPGSPPSVLPSTGQSAADSRRGQTWLDRSSSSSPSAP